MKSPLCPCLTVLTIWFQFQTEDFICTRWPWGKPTSLRSCLTTSMSFMKLLASEYPVYMFVSRLLYTGAPTSLCWLMSYSLTAFIVCCCILSVVYLWACINCVGPVSIIDQVLLIFWQHSDCSLLHLPFTSFSLVIGQLYGVGRRRRIFIITFGL